MQPLGGRVTVLLVTLVAQTQQLLQRVLQRLLQHGVCVGEISLPLLTKHTMRHFVASVGSPFYPQIDLFHYESINA
jgi:hypothetical protein